MKPGSIKKNKTGLYGIFFKRLEELNGSSHPGIIRFPVVFKKLCRNFSITKKECWGLLFTLRDFEMIEIVPFQGIRIKESGAGINDSGSDKDT